MPKHPPQAGLPPVTSALWRALYDTFPSIIRLESWGDAAHAARRSDHNRDTTSGKLGPRAIDVFLAGAPSATYVIRVNQVVLWALEPANRDAHCISLVISRRVEWSGRTGWRPHEYKGADPHTGHIHISCDA